MMNIINGGVHADNPIDFQEFMIIAVGAKTFARRWLRWRVGDFHNPASELKKAGHNTMSAMKRLRAEPLPSADGALEFVMSAIGKAGLQGRSDVMLALTARPLNFQDGK